MNVTLIRVLGLIVGVVIIAITLLALISPSNAVIVGGVLISFVTMMVGQLLTLRAVGEAKQTSLENQKKIEEVHTIVNGKQTVMLETLVEQTEKIARAESRNPGSTTSVEPHGRKKT